MKNTRRQSKNYLVLLALSLFPFFMACSSDDSDPTTPEVTLPENVLANGMAFTKTGGKNTLNVKSNVAIEVISSAPDWCKVTAETSASTTVFKYTIDVTENPTTQDRTATITVMAGSSKAGEFTVTQTAAEGLIIDSGSKSFDVSPEGGTIVVKLTTNGEVTATPDVSWITAPQTRAMAEKTFTFTVAKNVIAERVGHISFTLGNLTETVTVKQAQGESSGMSSDAQTLASKMYAGINIGNTMEVPGGETGWGNPKVNKAYIDGLKAMGFNAVRIPCAWDSYIVNPTTYEIDPTWLNRVSEVVGYCVSNDMYAIVNIHWDGGWLEDHIFGGVNAEIDAKLKAVWTQIGTKLNDYDEHLLFAGCNEPGMNETTGTNNSFKNPEDIRTIMKYEQTFVDAVRATGGNNASRCLVVQAPGTRISDAISATYAVPEDVATNRLMVEVHYYAPYQFCLMEEDAGWGKVFWYWGADNHVSGSEHNATSGEESAVKEQFQKMKTHFVDKGIPVVLGEYSAMKRTVAENQAAHDQSRGYWNEVVTREAKNHGIVPFHWETGGEINRHTGAATDHYVIDGILKGAKEGKYPYK